MTPKEKSKELINKYHNTVMSTSMAIRCAIIAVQEILEFHKPKYKHVNFWYEVLIELKKELGE